MKPFVWLLILFKLHAITASDAQSFHDIVITEIMADPIPVVGLPAVEYLEIYNRTGQAIAMTGWKLAIDSRLVVLPAFQIGPEEYILLCHIDNESILSSFGKVIGVSTFILPNAAARLSIYNGSNQLVYSFYYKNSLWSSSKNDGGYALEMKDIAQPCIEEANWAVSEDPHGGTPGRRNSVVQTLYEFIPPEIEHLLLRASNSEVVIRFNKGMDSLNTVQALVNIDGNGILNKRMIAPDFRELVLQLSAPLLPLEPFQLEISNATDCGGQLMKPVLNWVGLPTPSQMGDVVLNEILFNPQSEGVDFVEIHNVSNRFISLKNWELANLKDEKVDVRRPLTLEEVLLPPSGFIALTTNTNLLRAQYPTDQHRNMMEMVSMPPYPNTNGGIALLDEKGVIQDKLSYSEKMHSQALNTYKGISLERINPKEPADDPRNWASASALSGFATPGYVNSQYNNVMFENEFLVEPEAFSPNGDGQDDMTYIRFEQKYSGRIASVKIFNIQGMLVSTLIDQQLIGTHGQMGWDGVDQHARLVPPGHYVLFIEVFDHAGYQIQIRKKVVVLY